LSIQRFAMIHFYSLRHAFAGVIQPDFEGAIGFK